MRPDAGAAPTLSASALGDPEARERRLQPLGGRERRARDVGGPPVARVVLVRRQGRERRDVGRVVGGPARAHAARVEEALVGDDRAAHQADAPGAERPSRGRRAGSPCPAGSGCRRRGWRAPGRRSRAGRSGPSGRAPRRTLVVGAKRWVWKRKAGPSWISAPALVTSFIVEAGMRGVSARKLATGTPVPDAVDPPDQRGGGRVRAAEGRDGALRPRPRPGPRRPEPERRRDERREERPSLGDRLRGGLEELLRLVGEPVAGGRHRSHEQGLVDRARCRSAPTSRRRDARPACGRAQAPRTARPG